MPAAPMSSARLTCISSLADRRTTHGVGAAACISACICAVSSGECSASMNSQSKPTSARSSTAAGEFSVTSGATNRSPDRNRVRKDEGIRGIVPPLQWIFRDDGRVSRDQVPATLTGQSILHYNIHERLGSGGSGEVYVAEDTRLGRQVALKFLNADRQRDADSRARLLREARAASMLRSPNIAVTYEFVEHGDLLFIAMEYVEGEVLSERIARGPVPIAEVGRHRRPGCRCTRRGAQPQHRPSRHQERQSHTDAARSREGPRLRPRQDGDSAVDGNGLALDARVARDITRHGARHDRLHGARAAARGRRRSSRRSVRARCRAVRAADGAAAVSRQHARRHLRSDLSSGAGADLPLCSRRARGARADRPQSARRSLRTTAISRRASCTSTCVRLRAGSRPTRRPGACARRRSRQGSAASPC